MLSGFNTVNPQQIDPYWYQETKFNESCEQMNGNVKKKGHTDQQHLIQIDLFCNDGWALLVSPLGENSFVSFCFIDFIEKVIFTVVKG